MGIFAIASNRWAKWLLLAAWAAVVAFLAGSALEFNGAQNNHDANFLPKSAESLKAIRIEERGFDDQLLTGMLVYRDEQGLNAADRAVIRSHAGKLQSRPVPGQFGGATPLYFKDGKTGAVYLQMRAHGDSQMVFAAADQLRALGAGAPDGLTTKLTGQIGYIDDSVGVFSSIDGKLLSGTVLLIAVLLLVIYRSPLLWLLPLASVGMAEMVLRGVGTRLAEQGMMITTQAAALTTVLVFGVGTDYALLLIARYREELRRHECTHVAMTHALKSSGPPILASAATVAAAMLTMILADVNATSGAGPIGALGIGIAMVSMLTVLPSLLLVFGRRAFWPFVPRFEGVSDAVPVDGVWSRLADRIAARPRMISIGVLGVMGVMALGLTAHDKGLDLAESFREDVESVQGQRLLKDALPPGATGPLTVVTTDAERVPAVVAALESSRHVAEVGLIQRGGNVVRVEATLKYAPYSQPAIDAVKPIRALVGQAAPGVAFVAGPSAVEADSRHFAAKDNRLIMPLALLVVTLILILLLRSLVAPLVLMLTVVASFFAVLGVSFTAFTHLLGFPGTDEYLPLFVFIFLVALGVDYNIFLMARVREEVAIHGAREGMRRGLIVTGGVITSAGVVLAGTFLVMASMPITMLTEIGFAIALGVLFDALIVRTALVPALGFLMGRAMWWPSRLSRVEVSTTGEHDATDGDRFIVTHAPSADNALPTKMQSNGRIDSASNGHSGITAADDESPVLPDWTRLN